MDLLTERRVQRRTAKVNKRRVENNPLWASAGEAVLAAVAGPVRTAEATWNELTEMQLSFEVNMARYAVRKRWRQMMLCEQARGYFTAGEFEWFEFERERTFLADPLYGIEYWQELLRELGLEPCL